MKYVQRPTAFNLGLHSGGILRKLKSHSILATGMVRNHTIGTCSIPTTNMSGLAQPEQRRGARGVGGHCRQSQSMDVHHKGVGGIINAGAFGELDLAR